MSPKRQRLVFLLLSAVMIGLASFYFFRTFRDNLVFFYSPTELQEKNLAKGGYVRIGGLVQIDSLIYKDQGKTLEFLLTDGNASMRVVHKGTAPSLFREGQGVVVEGIWQGTEPFTASRLLAKHDENYMPPEVADALKKTGHWKDDYRKGARP